MVFLALLAFGVSFYGQSFFAEAGVVSLLSTEGDGGKVAVMKLNETQIDFGKVPQNQAVSHRFVFTNQGDAPLVITSVKPGCSCTVADYSKGEIQPGESGFIVASYNAKKTGVFHKSVAVQTNTEVGLLHLHLKGEVVPTEK